MEQAKPLKEGPKSVKVKLRRQSIVHHDTATHNIGAGSKPANTLTHNDDVTMADAEPVKTDWDKGSLHPSIIFL